MHPIQRSFECGIAGSAAGLKQVQLGMHAFDPEVAGEGPRI
jgi:hypothetical protein